MQAQPVDTPPPVPAGWYPDPWQVAPQRWWDGLTWTGHTHGAALPVPAAPAADLSDSRLGGTAVGRTYVPPTGAGAPGGWGPLVDAPPEPPRARTDIRGGGVAVLGFFGSVAIALIFARAAMSRGAADTSLTVLIAGQAGLWSGFTMTAFIVTHRRAGGSFTDLGLRAPTAAEIRLGIGIGIVGLMAASRVAVALQHLFPNASPGSGTHLYTASRPNMTVILVSAALARIGAPIFEEMFFRGIVQPILTGRLGVPTAIVVQALLFGAAHYQLGMTLDYAIVRCGTVATMGLLLGWLREHTGRLGAGMVAHATNNIIVILLALAALNR